MNKLLLILMVIGTGTLAYGQDYGKSPQQYQTVKALPKQSKISLQEELEGTYQIESIHGKKVLLTDELFEFVKNSRLQSQSQWLDFNSDLKVFIPSYDAISSPSFKKLPLIK